MSLITKETFDHIHPQKLAITIRVAWTGISPLSTSYQRLGFRPYQHRIMLNLLNLKSQ